MLMGAILGLTLMVKESLIMVYDIVKEREKHIIVASLKFAFSETVEELCHDGLFCSWISALEMRIKIFCESAFATARFSLYVEKFRSFRIGPIYILVMRPNPLEGATVP